MVCQSTKQLLIVSCYLNSSSIEKMLIEENIHVYFYLNVLYSSVNKRSLMNYTTVRKYLSITSLVRKINELVRVYSL